MSKVILYRFYSLEDFLFSLEAIERSAAEYEKKIPGVIAETKSSISDEDYFVELYIRYEEEDNE